MDSSTANFLQVLDDAVNDNLEKAAEKKGMAVQELMMIFQESGWKKDTVNNQVQLEQIHKICGKVTVKEKVVNKYNKESLAYAS